MGVDIKEDFLQKEEWIDTVKSPMSKKVWIYSLVDDKYELKHSCTLNDKIQSIRFSDLVVDLSDVELIQEND